jgi:hypothetical protein
MHACMSVAGVLTMLMAAIWMAQTICATCRLGAQKSNKTIT